MSAPARTSLRSLITPRLSARDLAARTSSTARIYSALTDWPGLSRDQGLALVAAETTTPEEIQVVESFSDERHEGHVITGRIQGEPTAQILFATFGDQGEITELKSCFKYMYPFTLIREQVRQSQPGIPAEAWTVRPLPPDTGEFHESPKSFPYAPDLVFHSPVMRAPFTPEPAATLVLSHAHSVYGVRKWSGLRLENGDRRLGWFDADISGLPIEIPVVLTVEGTLAKEMNAFSRPWPAALALYSRVTARLRGKFGPEHDWGDKQPGYDSYL